MRINNRKLEFYKLEKYPDVCCPTSFTMQSPDLWEYWFFSLGFPVKMVLNLSLDFKIPAPVPGTPESEELKKRLALYRSFWEEELKVEDLVSTQLLWEHGLIAKSQSVDNISNIGLGYAQQIIVEVSKIMKES
uniref:Uncharacterized protein n=1 Tax=Cannabis sativa TaxID=3483 RepID=A0A803QJQ1_CANSA